MLTAALKFLIRPLLRAQYQHGIELGKAEAIATGRWVQWTHCPDSDGPPDPAPPPLFLSTLCNSPHLFDPERTLLRLSAAAEQAAQNTAITPDDHARWLHAVIVAHRNWNADFGQDAYSWPHTIASEAMTSLLPKVFPGHSWPPPR